MVAGMEIVLNEFDLNNVRVGKTGIHVTMVIPLQYETIVKIVFV